MSRRKRTLPFSLSSGPDPDLKITKERWRLLEIAIGEDISSQLRSDLIDATKGLLLFAGSEFHAEPVDAATKHLGVVGNAATRLLSILNKNEHGVAKRYANYLIGPSFHKLVDVLPSFVEACNKANEQVASGAQPSFTRGQHWESWVLKITALLKTHGHPVGARKDTDKSKGQSSPFVRFVHELQKSLPTKYRRGQQSLTALAEVIAKARRGRKQ